MSVVVIVCLATGWALPTGTLPTMMVLRAEGTRSQKWVPGSKRRPDRRAQGAAHAALLRHWQRQVYCAAQ